MQSNRVHLLCHDVKMQQWPLVASWRHNAAKRLSSTNRWMFPCQSAATWRKQQTSTLHGLHVTSHSDTHVRTSLYVRHETVYRHTRTSCHPTTASIHDQTCGTCRCDVIALTCCVRFCEPRDRRWRHNHLLHKVIDDDTITCHADKTNKLTTDWHRKVKFRIK